MKKWRHSDPVEAMLTTFWALKYLLLKKNQKRVSMENLDNADIFPKSRGLIDYRNERLLSYHYCFREMTVQV